MRQSNLFHSVLMNGNSIEDIIEMNVKVCVVEQRGESGVQVTDSERNVIMKTSTYI